MERQRRRLARRARRPRSSIAFERSADMRFAGQGFEVETGLPLGQLTRREAQGDLGQLHRQLPPALRARAGGVAHRRSVLAPAGHRAAAEILARSRAAGYGLLPRAQGQPFRLFPPGAGFRGLRRRTIATSSHRRAGCTGPAVIEERESTVVVGPGATVDTDHGLNLIVSLP